MIARCLIALRRFVGSFSLLLALAACASDPAGNTALIQAAWTGDAASVEALLKSGTEVDAANRVGMTALMAATWGSTGRGHAGIARALIAKGANVNAANVYGRTALMEVAGNGNLEFARLLLAAGADVNARADDGATPLHEAALNGRAEIVRILLEGKARPDLANAQGQTPLMLACYCPAARGNCPERPGIAAMLVEAGADARARDAKGRSVMQWVLGGTAAEREAVKQVILHAGAAE